MKYYLARFRLWCITQEELADEKKNAHFLWSVGKEAYDLIQTITFPREHASVPHKELLDTILDHFKPANFVAAEWARFYSHMRQPDEKAQKFILRVQAQAAKCNFGESWDSALRDRLISGINNVSLKKKLLLLEDRTFLAARKLCAA